MMTETPDDVTPRKKKPEPSAEAAAAAAELVRLAKEQGLCYLIRQNLLHGRGGSVIASKLPKDDLRSR
jgi:putative transposase